MNTEHLEQHVADTQEITPDGSPATPVPPEEGGTTRSRMWRPTLLLVLALVVATVVPSFGSRDLASRLATFGGAALFLALAMMSTFGVAAQLRGFTERRIGNAHAGVLRLIVVLAGGFTTLLTTLSLLSVPIGQLVLGGALTGVIFGIAGQQTLSNLFAGIVLLLARPFTVGARVQLRSGALGGTIDGQVLEIGLAYLRLQTDEGQLSVPNNQVLNAVVGPSAS
jgi:small-conductance mechanosensitive channel